MLNSTLAKVVVREVAVSERAAARDLLVSAFERMPFARWAFPDDAAGRQAAHARLFDHTFAQGGAVVEGAYDTVSSTLLAVAVWFPPGCLMTEEEELPGSSAPRPEAAALFAAVDAATPPRSTHHYLAFLGSAQRGGGGGSALLRHRLGCFDGEPFCLWTGDEANLGFYARFGFEVQRRLDFPGASAWWLTRPAAGA